MIDYDKLAKDFPDEIVDKASEIMLAQSKAELLNMIAEVVDYIQKMEEPSMNDDSVKSIVEICDKIMQRFLVISCFVKNDLALLGQVYDAMKRDAYKGFHLLAASDDDVSELIKKVINEKTPL